MEMMAEDVAAQSLPLPQHAGLRPAGVEGCVAEEDAERQEAGREERIGKHRWPKEQRSCGQLRIPPYNGVGEGRGTRLGDGVGLRIPGVGKDAAVAQQYRGEGRS